jgi:hypothetical protein
MVESIHRKGFAYLRDGRRTKKENFRNWTAAMSKLGQPSRPISLFFIGVAKLPWSACQGYENLAASSMQRCNRLHQLINQIDRWLARARTGDGAKWQRSLACNRPKGQGPSG